jgi:hypothetical protein
MCRRLPTSELSDGKRITLFDGALMIMSEKMISPLVSALTTNATSLSA